MSLVELAVILMSTVVAGVKSEYLQPVNQNGSTRFDLSTLQFVSVYARHGNRSPLSTFPKDPCPFTNLTYWPNGEARLTNSGKTQSYNLGKQLKSRYRGFISNQYYDNETIFQSNAVDRDLTSSQLMAAGMYPPTGFQIWNYDLLWQPIGVWITAYDVDDTSGHCERFIEERVKVMDALGEKLRRENPEFLAEVANVTGIELNEVHSELTKVWQTGIIQPEDGCPNKIEWADAVFMEKLFPLAALSFRTSVVGNDVMTSLEAGPVLETLIEQLHNKTQGTLGQDRRMSVLAGHDTTIVSLLAGLGIDELILPEVASALVFELHKSDGGNRVQLLFFNRSTTAAPTLFEIPDCPQPCSLNDFTRVARKTIVNSGRENCENRRESVTPESRGPVTRTPTVNVSTSLPSNDATFTSPLIFHSSILTVIVILIANL